MDDLEPIDLGAEGAHHRRDLAMPIAVVALTVAAAAVAIFLLRAPNSSGDLERQVSAQERRIDGLTDQNETLRTQNEALSTRVRVVETLSRRVEVVEAQSDAVFDSVQQLCQAKALADVPECQGE